MADAPIPLAGAPLPMRAPAAAPQDEIRRVAAEFETIFIGQMLAPMFAGLKTDGLGGGGAGEEMFRPMLIERYAEALSRAGGVGIADSIVAELTRMQSQQRADLGVEASDGVDR